VKIDPQTAELVVRAENRVKPPKTTATSAPADGVSVEGQEEARAMATKLETDDGVDSARVATIAAQMIDGKYEVEPEKVAAAILGELGWVAQWLNHKG
jgi:anti-sigma28 factor (negative regulator of flagellin synthesis)